jgi:hypothetical protein
MARISVVSPDPHLSHLSIGGQAAIDLANSDLATPPPPPPDDSLSDGTTLPPPPDECVADEEVEEVPRPSPTSPDPRCQRTDHYVDYRRHAQDITEVFAAFTDPLPRGVVPELAGLPPPIPVNTIYGWYKH